MTAIKTTISLNSTKLLLGTLSSLLVANSGLALPTEVDAAKTPSDFQSAIEKLHSELLLSECHSNNPEFQQKIEVLASHDSSIQQRCDAATSIGGTRIVTQSMLTPLVRIFSSEREYAVKSALALALVNLAPTVAVQLLLSGIESKDADYKQLCIAAICSGGKSMVSPLSKALKCPDPNMRRQSAEALAELGANAINAVPVLKEISSDPDENSLFSRQAADVAASIKRDYDEKTGPDVAFNSDKWKDENGRHYRFRMVHDLIESRVLIGLHTSQLQVLLGRGVSFFKGSQWRYALGLRGKGTETLIAKGNNKKEKIASHSRDFLEQTLISEKVSKTRETRNQPRIARRVTVETDQEQFLVVHVVDDVVTNCQLLAYDPDAWNISNLDSSARSANSSSSSSTSTASIIAPRLHAGVSYALFSTPQKRLPILDKIELQMRK